MRIHVGEERLYTLLFAEDHVLIANDRGDIKQKKINERILKVGLKLNTDETEHLVVGATISNIQLRNNVISGCREYKYPGSLIRKGVNMEISIKEYQKVCDCIFQVDS